MKKQKLLIICLAVLVAAGIFGIFLYVHAQSSLELEMMRQQAALGNAAGVPQARDPRLIVAQFIKGLLTMLGLLSTITLVYGGFTIFTSQGEEEKITKGRKTIQYAFIGVIITLSAYMIAFTTYRMIYKSMVNPFGSWSYWGITADTDTPYVEDKMGGDTVLYPSLQ